jgi:hypothetical protein
MPGTAPKKMPVTDEKGSTMKATLELTRKTIGLEVRRGTYHAVP